ncbi:MAG: HAMP domain-containing histidine kinase [Candidatus Marinimicrobia bacterium]|nr:HAMP domain-containing histidine kinase [Candidatus Neomarinimicrobiota bacterium]
MRMRIEWFINLRWFLVFIIFTIIEISNISHYPLGVSQLYCILSVLTFLNIIYIFIEKYYPFKTIRQELVFAEIQMMTDIVCLSFIIHYIGGIRNPFYFIYFIHIVISGIMFQGSLPYINSFFTVLVLSAWTLLEFLNLVTKYPLNTNGLTVSEISISLLSFSFLIFAITYIITDFVSRFRKMKKMIDEKSELLKTTMEERDKIFRFTAHELKSPLTTMRSILAIISMLHDIPHEKERVKDMIQRAEKRNDQVLDMVKDMIEITHFKQDKESKVKKKVNWGEWVEYKIFNIHEYADAKNIKMIYHNETFERDITVITDSMDKIVDNLINNAIRYTPEGGQVDITAFVNSKKYGITVRDTGIGMSADDKVRIFDEFFRSAEARRMEKIGTGLGLSLVKEIVDKLGGSIAVESTPEKGSEFKVVLPIQKKKD